MMIPACLLTLSGCAVLVMGMARHQRQFWGTQLTAPYKAATQAIAYILFAASLLVCLTLPDTYTIDSVLSVMTWLGLFPLSALVLVGLLTAAPKTIIPVSVASVVLGGGLAIQGLLTI